MRATFAWLLNVICTNDPSPRLIHKLPSHHNPAMPSHFTMPLPPTKSPTTASVRKLVIDYHKNRTPKKVRAIRKAFFQLLESGQQLPPKVAHKKANKLLVDEMTLLDQKISRAQRTRSKQRLEVARQDARNFSDKHFVVSRFFPEYEDGGEEEGEEGEEEGEEGGEKGEEGEEG